MQKVATISFFLNLCIHTLLQYDFAAPPIK